MAKSVPNCSSISRFGLFSLSDLRPFVPGRSPGYSLRSSPRNLLSVSIGCRPSYHHRFLRSVVASSGAGIDPEDSLAATVFIKGLPLSTGEGELKRAFSGFGDVTRVKIFLNKETMQPLGTAFVWFDGKESAELAVKEMDGKFFNGRFIAVAMARRQQIKRQQSTAPFEF
ncbi:hypothetical protein MLD38_016887 [Melastoma candidum]|uniref:Uncharacterized protein n=1 Tax=Melastoma candidum TaxID=119954 RepID=A0ACB9QSC0_9MYRT|nr:hypothetical protein MLD38_016887 [Melastoma candidum]